MADAPAGGGGISGPEIIVLVVLVLGALAVLSGHPISPVQNAPAPKTTVAAQCAISLTRPRAKETVGSVATVVGSITPCSPQDPLTTNVNVEVVDSTGALMSVYGSIPVTAADNTRGTFSANVPITGSPAAGIGYVIVTGPNRSDGTTSTARRAIQFAHY